MVLCALCTLEAMRSCIPVGLAAARAAGNGRTLSTMMIIIMMQTSCLQFSSWAVVKHKLAESCLVMAVTALTLATEWVSVFAGAALPTHDSHDLR